MPVKSYQVHSVDPNSTTNHSHNNEQQAVTIVQLTTVEPSWTVTDPPTNHNDPQQEGDCEADQMTTCGIGQWRPQWLQVFATPTFFMLNMALVGITQGMTGTLFFSSISTFEKRYAFDSKISGVILIADNFAEMILNPIVGYLGVRYNRARLIAVGEVILSVSCFLTAFPYFLYGPATHLASREVESFVSSLGSGVSNRTQLQMCLVNATTNADQCDGTNAGVTVWPAVFFLVLGSFARGLGYTCYFVIGFPYLDDNVSKKRSPIYISAMQAIRLLGPGTGFMLSSAMLRFYENPFVDPGFGRTDPRWVGAWWLSFCVVGILLLFLASPLFLFPPQFKDASVQTVEINKKIKESGGSRGALKRFVTNPVVMLCMWGNIFRYIGTGGFFMFKSKYIESQFRQSSSSASFITGGATYFPVAIGIILGGSFIAFLKPSVRFIFILVFLVESVSIFTIGSGLFLGCDPINIGGGMDHKTGMFSLQSDCNKNCHCSTKVYTPVCAPDSQTTFFSPCHAGCTMFDANSSSFENCACFSGAASKGYCQSDVTKCTNLYKYVSIVAIGGIVANIAKTPNSLIALRNVDPMDKGFAIGMATTLFDIFAFIPYPLLFGYIADKACLVWENKCGKTGNCWVYDHDKFRYYLHGWAVFFLALGSFFDFLTIFYSGRMKNFYDDDDEENEKKDANVTDAPKIEETELKDF